MLLLTLLMITIVLGCAQNPVPLQLEALWAQEHLEVNCLYLYYHSISFHANYLMQALVA